MDNRLKFNLVLQFPIKLVKCHNKFNKNVVLKLTVFDIDLFAK